MKRHKQLWERVVGLENLGEAARAASGERLREGVNGERLFEIKRALAIGRILW